MLAKPSTSHNATWEILTFLNMLKLRGAPKRLVLPIQVAHPLVQVRIPGANVAQVALEVLDVDGIEADDCGVEADVGFGGVRGGEQVGGGGLGEGSFDAVEGGEEGGHVFGVGFFGAAGVWSVRCSNGREERVRESIRSEAGLVHAVVDVVVDPVVHLFDVFLQVFGVKVNVLVLLGELVVEGGVEHADDFAAFVADDLAGFLVVESGHGEASAVVGVLLEVDVPDVREVLVDWVGRCEVSRDIFALFGESPAYSHVSG